MHEFTMTVSLSSLYILLKQKTFVLSVFFFSTAIALLVPDLQNQYNNVFIDSLKTHLFLLTRASDKS